MTTPSSSIQNTICAKTYDNSTVMNFKRGLYDGLGYNDSAFGLFTDPCSGLSLRQSTRLDATKEQYTHRTHADWSIVLS